MFILSFLLLNGWSPDILISEGYTSYPNQHNIACDASGDVHATWYRWHHSGLWYTVWYQYYTGGQWMNLKEISVPGGFIPHGYPSIATSPNGNEVYCVWKGHWVNYSDILLRRFLGGNWEDTVIYISRDINYSYSPSMVCDGQNVLHIVWEKGYEIHYRTLYGSVLSDDIVLSNSRTYAAYPSIAVFNNKIFVVWEDLRDGNFELYFKEYNGTQWSPDRRVTTSTSASIFPSLCVDSSGVVHIVWQEDGPEGYGIFYTSYAQDFFTPPTLIVDSPGEAITPSITSAGNELYLVWSDSRAGDWEIYYKNYNGSWGDETRLTNSPGVSANPSICADINGNLYLLFCDSRDPPIKVYFKKKTNSKKKIPIIPELTVSPNPFTRSTIIRLQITDYSPETSLCSEFKIQIHDIAGRVVCTLPIHNPLTPITEVMWDGTDNQGLPLNSGLYFVNLVGANGCSPLPTKIILIR